MLGTDIEFFAQGTDGLIIPALKVFENSGLGMSPVFKEIFSDLQPNGYESLEYSLPHAKLTEDGLAIETPIDPSGDVDDLMNYLHEGIVASLDMVESAQACLIAAPLVYLNPSDLAVRPELRVLGCAPDRDLYYGAMECRPSQDPRETNWRTGGGHIHFSCKNILDPDVVQALVLLCDLVLGTADVLLEHSADGRKRREMYGQPGKYRLQPWGVEYRTMSNVWAVHPEVTRAVLGLAHALHSAIDGGFDTMETISEVDILEVIRAITECDHETAYALFSNGVESLDKSGYDVTAYSTVQDFYRAGGIVNAFGYNMSGWRRG